MIETLAARSTQVDGRMRPVCLRPQDVVEFSAKVDLGRERLQSQMKKSLNCILDEQHPVSHLFPAATVARYDKEHRYDETWIRDLYVNGMTLFNEKILEIYPKGEEMGDRIRSSGESLIKGQLKLFSKEPWVRGFEQEIVEDKDQWGRAYTRLTEEAPPIHFKVDGECCSWPTQNQPEAYGGFLSATAKGIKQGIVRLDEEEKKTLGRIAGYLTKAQLDRFKHTAMWEMGEVYQPGSLSTLAICAMGLEEISPYLADNLKEKTKLEAERLRKEVSGLFPNDYTVPDGHKSKTDLATLVAFSVGALKNHSIVDYFKIADVELGNGDHLGKRRWIGDIYGLSVPGQEEATWLMGSIMEAKVCLESKEQDEGVKLKERGLNSLRKVMMVHDVYDYSPELFMVQGGVIVPSVNHLLWNEAETALTCAVALDLV